MERLIQDYKIKLEVNHILNELNGRRRGLSTADEVEKLEEDALISIVICNFKYLVLKVKEKRTLVMFDVKYFIKEGYRSDYHSVRNRINGTHYGN